MSTSTSTIKDDARRIIDRLPDNATWDDLIYEIYVRQSVEAGLQDVAEGQTLSIAEVRRRLGLSP